MCEPTVKERGGAQSPPGVIFAFGCLSTVTASLLFTACLLNCCRCTLARCPDALELNQKPALMEVTVSKWAVCSGCSRHRTFRLPENARACMHFSGKFYKYHIWFGSSLVGHVVRMHAWNLITHTDTNTPAFDHTHTHTAGQWPKGCGDAQHLSGAKLCTYPPISSLLWTNLLWLVSVFIIFVLLLAAQLEFN